MSSNSDDFKNINNSFSTKIMYDMIYSKFVNFKFAFAILTNLNAVHFSIAFFCPVRHTS